jgi:hypothetical protein
MDSPPPPLPPPPAWSPPPPIGSPGGQARLAGPLPVLVLLPERNRQRRWTVAIRWILAIPLGIALYFVGIAVVVVAIIGWIGALFMGRAPTFMRRLMTFYLELTINFLAYAYLLTDRFPPLNTDVSSTYPARLAVPEATRLNRWAVLFRLILAFPVSMLGAIVSGGMSVFGFFLWLITLCTGWLPLPAHDAYRAVFRFQIRVSAYTYLLVPTYPSGLFGEPSPPTFEGSPSPSWSLTLGKGARRMVVISIVLGALYYGGIAVFVAVGASRTDQVTTLNSATSTLNKDFAAYQTNTTACATTTDRVACVEASDRNLSGQLTAFATTIDGLTVSGLSPNAIANAVTAARATATIFNQLAHAGPTVADYQQAVSAVNLQGSVNTLQTALNQV